MTDRYKQNLNIARQIAEQLGFKLVACDPDWRLKGRDERLFSVDDEFMERMAIGLGFDWAPKTDIRTLATIMASRRNTIKVLKNSITRAPDEYREDWEDYVQYTQNHIEDLEKEVEEMQEEMEFMNKLSNGVFV